MNVLMISGDTGVIKNIDGPFSLTLSELSKNWEQIDILCPGMAGHQRNFRNNVRLLGVRKFLLVFDLLKQLRTNHYDLIVTHDYGLMLNGLSVFFLNSFFKIPHITELHHIEGYPIAVSLKERFYATWGKIYVYFIAKHFNAIRVDNWGAIVSLLKRLGLNESKLIYLPPIYLELEKFRPLNIEKKYDIIFVGRFVENKGIFILLKSILLLKQQNILLKTCLKGRGPLTHSILQFIKDNNLADLVQINQNNLNEKELIEFYNQGKVLVCASTVEGGPRVTFEAMACDVPVITTGCGLMPECIKNGENGFIFDGTAQDLADKLKEIFLDLNLYKKIQVHSRNSVLKYDYKITLEAYATSYRKRIGK